MDCAFELGYRCVALTDKKCKGCHFRKTQKELEKGRKKAKKRIASLLEAEQQYIKEKYYRKERLWEQK